MNKPLSIDELIEREELSVHGNREIIKKLDKTSKGAFSRLMHGVYTAHRRFQKITDLLDVGDSPEDSIDKIWKGPRYSIKCGDGTASSTGSEALAGTIFLAADIGGYSNPLSKEFPRELSKRVELEMWLNGVRYNNNFTPDNIDSRELVNKINARVSITRKAYKELRVKVRKAFIPYIQVSEGRLSETKYNPKEDWLSNKPVWELGPWNIQYAVNPNRANNLPKIILDLYGKVEKP